MLNKKTRVPKQVVAGKTPEQSRQDFERQLRLFYDKVSPWVNKGTVYGFNMRDELNKPTILEYESAICALAPVTTGSVLGITCGKRSHLFYFHPCYYIADLGILSETPVTGGAIVKTQADMVVGGWHGPAGGGMFRHDAVREFGTGQEDMVARKDPVMPIALPDRNEGVLALAYDDAARKVFALTTTNRILSLSDDSKKVKVEAQADSPFAPVLLRLPDGALLGACEHGQLWQYRPGEKRIEKLDAFAPCEKGKRYVAGVQSLLLTQDGVVYGGTSTDGFFFSYCPARPRVVNLGKPHRQSFIRALTEGHDGRIYGIVEEPKGMARFFSFDPEERGFEDLGVLNTFIPIQWAPHSIGALCTGIHGEIFLGESDTLSHLFVYYPPVFRRRRSEESF
jgi:hypothetical protein